MCPAGAREPGLIEVIASGAAPWQAGAGPGTGSAGERTFEGKTPMFKHVLIATDGSELAQEAADKAIELAKALGARATAVVVIEPFHVLTVNVEQLERTRQEYDARAKRQADEILGAIKAKAEAAGVALAAKVVHHDHPYEAIIRTAAAEGCDLVTMGSHGRRGVAGLLLGSQTTRVLTHSKVPVLVFR
jgi:nucleotide-binding universal stress UspA family protein